MLRCDAPATELVVSEHHSMVGTADVKRTMAILVSRLLVAYLLYTSVVTSTVKLQLYSPRVRIIKPQICLVGIVEA